jgi:hypothetical protein
VIKKLLGVVSGLLALNFIAMIALVGWLWKSQAIDKDKVAKIREIVFPTTSTSQPSTQPEDIEAATQPSFKLEELLASKVGKSTSEQVETVQAAFASQMALLERKSRELEDQKQQIESARIQHEKKRLMLINQQQTQNRKEIEASKQVSDKGFQDSLALYNTMAAKQVKAVFATLDDETVVKYLQAMQPRTASKIIKEFKTPDELTRIQRVMERMRQPAASTNQ